ncbi:hypothetical protein HOT99_gp135 [Caulobacter phage CcrBL10]|uniref:Uncharacterized protein n=1 Tax=Caulobacter phage CcrBL10 TaxID=2283269 RepID=A0A385EC90_9CAUD|nr:hypothetical protein HOT99_gp135 [Caulobacter phage CcrBL10]AXQ68482.1 hypothetical protein CcrBL10_gp278 [Caulobacter phage CcrBL10]
MTDYDACLTNWVVCLTPIPVVVRGDAAPEPGVVLVGEIMQDRKGRWPDGRLVHTSVLLSARALIKPGEVVRTLRSHYLLGRPAEEITLRHSLGAMFAQVVIQPLDNTLAPT